MHSICWPRRANLYPRLVLKGRDDEALTVLAALSDLDEEDEKVQSEFKAVKDVAFEMSRGGFRDCFRLNRNRNFHRTCLGYVNQMFQQISGINIITYDSQARGSSVQRSGK